MQVFSFGGGVQSMAALILSAQRSLPYTHFVFSNVGNDSENPLTLQYIKNVATPYAVQHGLEIIEIERTRRDGTPVTIYQDVMGDTSSICIPVHLKGSGPASRNCTSKWKANVVSQWMRKHAGASKTNRVALGVGISIDEYHRMRTDDPVREPYVRKEYPLIDMRVTRADCQRIISNAGLPLAPKSSCYFCPFKRRNEWARMRTDQPELFLQSVQMERRINEKRAAAGKDLVFLTAAEKPLDLATDEATDKMFDDDMLGCESGYCMT